MSRREKAIRLVQTMQSRGELERGRRSDEMLDGLMQLDEAKFEDTYRWIAALMPEPSAARPARGAKCYHCSDAAVCQCVGCPNVGCIGHMWEPYGVVPSTKMTARSSLSTDQGLCASCVNARREKYACGACGAKDTMGRLCAGCGRGFCRAHSAGHEWCAACQQRSMEATALARDVAQARAQLAQLDALPIIADDDDGRTRDASSSSPRGSAVPRCKSVAVTPKAAGVPSPPRQISGSRVSVRSYEDRLNRSDGADWEAWNIVALELGYQRAGFFEWKGQRYDRRACLERAAGCRDCHQGVWSNLGRELRGDEVALVSGVGVTKAQCFVKAIEMSRYECPELFSELEKCVLPTEVVHINGQSFTIDDIRHEAAADE